MARAVVVGKESATMPRAMPERPINPVMSPPVADLAEDGPSWPRSTWQFNMVEHSVYTLSTNGLTQVVFMVRSSRGLGRRGISEAAAPVHPAKGPIELRGGFVEENGGRRRRIHPGAGRGSIRSRRSSRRHRRPGCPLPRASLQAGVGGLGQREDLARPDDGSGSQAVGFEQGRERHPVADGDGAERVARAHPVAADRG